MTRTRFHALWHRSAPSAVALLLTACATTGPAATRPEAAPAAGPTPQSRPLVMYVAAEPTSVASRALGQKSASIRFSQRTFNALGAVRDARGEPQAELLAAFPTLNSSEWQVFPDGTMQTSYTLRPNLTWHDGQPLTADDYAFAWRVYSNPVVGLGGQLPMSAMSDVTAVDRGRFVIRWKQPYADADTISQHEREYPPLPQHLLGSPLDQLAATGPEAFVNNAYWGAQFIGLGPFRVQQWELGSYIDAVGFDGYALGAPKIPRIQLRFSADQNVVMASLLAGEAHAATDNAIPNFPEILIQQWTESGAGSVVQSPSSLRALVFQLRPEFVNPRVVLDPRVRRAIAHGVDRGSISEALYMGRGLFASTPVWPDSALGDALDDSIPTYPLDLRAAESLMNQAGFGKGPDGLYRGADGRLPPLELTTTESADSVRELLIHQDRLGAAGFEIQTRVIARAQAQDNQVRATFPALQVLGTSTGALALNSLETASIPTAANRWLGGNRGGWSSAEYDRLLSTFNTTLDNRERVATVRQMLRIYGEQVPWVTLFFSSQAFAQVAGLKGPGQVGPETNSVGWNLHAWEFNN